jgi:polyhydroxybutyrate depolymerase
MRTIKSASVSFVPAGHENPLSPGVLKKVLLEKTDLQPGCIQMVNWASLGVGKRFARHYHEDMQEIFILVQGRQRSRSERRDDVGFVRLLLDDLAKVANIDPKRVYATGISNGGIMCYRLAAELSDRIAAIAPVSGTMGTKTCNPKHPVSVIHFHGTDDKFLPFKGGIGDRSLAQVVFLPVEHSIQTWVKADGCPENPVITDLPNKADDGTMVQRQIYGPGKDGAEVVLFVINGGGHTWPGREPGVGFLGKSTKNILANDLMWEFFKRHPRK